MVPQPEQCCRAGGARHLRLSYLGADLVDARESARMTSYFLDEEYVGLRPGRRQELAWS